MKAKRALALCWLVAGCGAGGETRVPDAAPVDVEPPADVALDARGGAPDAAAMMPPRRCGGPPAVAGRVVFLTPAPPPIDPLAFGDPERLPPAELARRLARAYWAEDASPAFIDWVTACGPVTREQLGEMVARLLADPRAAGGFRAFAARWLELPAPGALSDKADPALTPALQAAMREETLLFVSDVALGAGAKLADLLARPSSFVTPELAGFYGLAAPPGPGFAKVALEPTVRAGILTQGSVLVATSGRSRTLPTMRGRWVQKQLLCRVEVPRDPVADRPVPPPSVELRAWLTSVTQGQPCLACHQTADPYGFALDAFDPVGRHQPEVGGRRVDTAARVDLEPALVPVDGAPGLARALANSGEAQLCFARTWLAHATGKQLPATDPSSQLVFQALERSGGDLRAAFGSAALSAAFLAP